MQQVVGKVMGKLSSFIIRRGRGSEWKFKHKFVGYVAPPATEGSALKYIKENIFGNGWLTVELRLKHFDTDDDLDWNDNIPMIIDFFALSAE